MPLHFEPIDISRRQVYQERLSQCSQIPSDYSFINLWGWGRQYGLQWAWDDRLVWLRQTRPQDAMWAPVGDWQGTDWPAALQAASDFGGRYIRIPEGLVQLWRQSATMQPQVAETREQWDYVYSIAELTSLKGNRFHKKKNLVRQFEKNYAFTYHILGPDLVTKTLSMQEDWCTWRDCESNDMLTAENEALVRILNDWDKLPGITGGVLEVEGSLAAYTVAEIMPDQSLVIHFEKGNSSFKGSYQAINQQFLIHAPASCTLVNRGQDLGDEGLRKAKLSYHPIDYIRKDQVDWY